MRDKTTGRNKRSRKVELTHINVTGKRDGWKEEREGREGKKEKCDYDTRTTLSSGCEQKSTTS